MLSLLLLFLPARFIFLYIHTYVGSLTLFLCLYILLLLVDEGTDMHPLILYCVGQN